MLCELVSYRIFRHLLEKLTKLGSLLAVNSSAGPIIGPSDIPILAQRDHGFNGEGHAGLALANSLVLGIMRNVGRAVEDTVDAVANISTDNAAVLALGMGLDRVAKVAEESAGLDHRNRLVQTLARSLNDPDSIRIGLGAVAYVIGLVEIAVEAFVVESDIKVDNIAIKKNALIGNAVANNLVD